MPTDVVMPALGMSQDTGKLLRWLVAEGQRVTKGQPLMEIETDKVTTEIEAPASGLLAGVRAQAGEEVPVGQVIAVILDAGEPVPQRAGKVQTSLPPAPAQPAGRSIAASPKARRLAHELGVDLAQVAGSGPDGEITASDVMRANPAARAAMSEAETAGSAWRVMADRLTRSWTSAPHFYLAREVSAHRLVERRKEFQIELPSLTITDLVIAHTAKALRQHPRMTAHWEDGKIAGAGRIGIGLAVATETGLVVPVLTRADELSLAEIVRLRFDLVTRAQAGRLKPDDVAGGTFTISNLGMYGVDAFYPILNPPQAAILGVGRIADRVVADGGIPAVRPMLTLTLTCDHRVVDGARAAEFLQTLVGFLEDLSS